MLTTSLGRTGLVVSRMGLGCGGHSRLGMARGATSEEASRIVREAIDLGVSFIDTAEAYGTEEAVGLGIEGVPRESVVVSTKIGLSSRPGGPSELRERLEGCLRRLRTEYVDVLHLHGVVSDEYAHARDVLRPEMVRLKEEGKIRHIGITEQFIPDPGHRMLSSAVEEGLWEVVMVGFNLLNPSARGRVLAKTQKNGVGTLCMFAVRRALGSSEALDEVLRQLEANGQIDPLGPDPLAFLTKGGTSLQEAAYRFCLWEPGIDVVLSGTGNVDHLRENARSLETPALSAEALARLETIFGRVDSVTGN